jgi:hypothetical protein
MMKYEFNLKLLVSFRFVFITMILGLVWILFINSIDYSIKYFEKEPIKITSYNKIIDRSFVSLKTEKIKY